MTDARIKNSHFLSLVKSLDQTSSGLHFNWLHGFAKKFYRWPYTPFFQQILRYQSQNPELKIILRHSSVDGSVFNVFRSDIDYSLILPDSATSADFDRLITAYEGWRKKLLFLGEAEVYTAEEYRWQKACVDTHEDLFLWIRLLRKWKHLEPAAWQTPYHREKAETSLDRAFFRLTQLRRPRDPRQEGKILGKKLSRFLEKEINPKGINQIGVSLKPFTGQPFTGYSKFLGWAVKAESVMESETEQNSAADLTDSDSDSAPVLVLSHPFFLILAAILPGGLFDFSAWHNEIRLLRADPTIRDFYRALASWEYLSSKSVERMTKTPDDKLVLWLEHLRSEIHGFETIYKETKSKCKNSPTP